MQTCETCRFLEPDNRPDYAGCGTCRRFPPIVVETVAFDDYVAGKGEAGAKEAGKFRVEGKTYEVKDGDVLLFRFNV